MLSEMLTLAEDGKVDHALALMVLMRRCLHQVALDQGSWQNALLLLPTKDPLMRSPFGGTEAELEAVHSYRRALNELTKEHARAGGDEGEGEENSEWRQPGGGTWWNKDQKPNKKWKRKEKDAKKE